MKNLSVVLGVAFVVGLCALVVNAAKKSPIDLGVTSHVSCARILDDFVECFFLEGDNLYFKVFIWDTKDSKFKVHLNGWPR